MTEPQKKAKAPGPPQFNGPAFLVFGLMLIVLGLSIDLNLMIGAGVMLVLFGAWGVRALKRYEKAEGIEEKLPGGGRYDADGEVKDEQ